MNEKNKVLDTNECEEQEQIIDLEDLVSALGQGEVETNEELLPPIELDISNIENCKIDKDEFEKGIKEASKTLGYFTCLKNGGLSNDVILQLILNDTTIQHNFELAKINGNTSIKVAEKQNFVMEKQQL